MRNLLLNKRKICGLRFKKAVKLVDSNNHYTGESRVEYYTAQYFYAHISGARGSSQVEVFGTDISYDKTILLTKSEFTKLGFDENTVFFVDKKLQYADNKITPLYDYRVKRIAETLNEVLIAIEKVSGNG